MKWSAIGLVTALVTADAQQVGNFGSPFPDSTYPNATSPNPNAIAGSQSNQTSPPAYPAPWASGLGDWADAHRKAIAFVSQLTLEEKVNLTSGTGWQSDRCVGQTGSIPRLGFRSQCLQDSPVGLRLSDFNSVFPAGVNVAATFDRGLAYARGQAMGVEHHGKGVDIQLGPVAGPLGRSPQGGRNWEGFSPDPFLTGVLFADTVSGIQSKQVQGCIKHFIANEQEHFRQIPEARGYGSNITDPLSSNLDDQTMHELYLWPFADAVRAGAATVMCSYNQVNNSHACQNSYLLNHLLKGELGFQGAVISDWAATYSGVSSALAGLDQTMPGDIAFNDGASYFGANLTIGVLNGTVPQWRLDDMAVRIVSAWYYVGRDNSSEEINFSSWTLDSFGHQNYFSEDNYGTVNEHVDVRAGHGALIRQIGAASTVLLKNVNNNLPLTANEKLTTVFGEDAGPNPSGPNSCPDRGCNIGTLAMAWGSGSSQYSALVTPDTAIQNEIVSRYGAYESITNNSAYTAIAALARRASQVNGVCIVFANANSGEGFIAVDENFGDRKNLTLWQGAEAVIANVTSQCNNTILVIHSTGPVELGPYKDNDNITAILWAGVPGEQSGNSIADVLYGRVNPAARLPFTIGSTRADYGTDILYEPNQPVPQANFEEGVFIDYRAFDRANITPVYEFGFGLSYTTFNYSNLVVKNVGAGEYAPAAGQTAAAPTFGTIDNDTSTHVFPDNFTRLNAYIYPWLSSANLSEAYKGTNYGSASFVPPNSHDSAPQDIHPAGGAPGGNPALWDVLYQVTATITNTGDVAGDEVPQLYISLGGPYDPRYVLRGFERLSIQPGQSATFTADVKRRDVSNWDVDRQNWIISPFEKRVFVGPSSRMLVLEGTLS